MPGGVVANAVFSRRLKIARHFDITLEQPIHRVPPPAAGMRLGRGKVTPAPQPVDAGCLRPRLHKQRLRRCWWRDRRRARDDGR